MGQWPQEPQEGRAGSVTWPRALRAWPIGPPLGRHSDRGVSGALPPLPSAGGDAVGIWQPIFLRTPRPHSQRLMAPNPIPRSYKERPARGQSQPLWQRLFIGLCTGPESITSGPAGWGPFPWSAQPSIILSSSFRLPPSPTLNPSGCTRLPSLGDLCGLGPSS